jgi:uncharacterized protein with von Willebrand factor type A (vWA) domain
MNIIEALLALKDGKRIARIQNPAVYFRYTIYELIYSNDKKRKCLVNQHFNPVKIEFASFDDDDWELVE